jgi:hypothetical protein
MRRQFPGLHAEATSGDRPLEDVFLVRVDWAFYRQDPPKPFFALYFVVLEPKEHLAQTISGRLYCTRKALWKPNWFLRDFGCDTDLLGRDEVDERALLGLTGIVRTSRCALRGRSFLDLGAFARAGEWEELAETGTRVWP